MRPSAREIRMTPRVRRLVAALTGLLVAPWLPLYPLQSMRRAQVIGHAGDVISHEWHFHSVPDLLDVLQYARPEESPERTLLFAVALALLVAAALALLVHRLLAALARR